MFRIFLKSKHHRWTGTFVLLLCIHISSCKDIFEDDLAQQNVAIQAPPDSLHTTSLTINFWWDEVEAATGYELQIAKPSFSVIQELVLDTLVEATIFSYTLEPGVYQWRVRAVNASSETPYTTHTLEIDSAIDLSQQIIVLQTPANDMYLDSLLTTFTWQAISAADNYSVQIASPDFSLTSNIVLDSLVTSNSISYTLAGEQEYQWRVRGLNDNSATPYAFPFNFSVDTTSPNIPVLLLPANNATETWDVSLYWDRGTVTGSPIADSLYIYSDSLTTLYYSAYTASTTYSDSFPVGDYFWRVRSIDEAGNKSSLSVLRKFIVN